MSQRGPALVAAACIVKDEQVLLARRSQPSIPEAHGKWELPGGKVEYEEAPDQAVIREIYEELGVRVNLVRLLPHIQNNIYVRSDGTKSHSVVLAFECVFASGDSGFLPKSEAVQEARWFPWRDLPRTDEMLPGTVEFVQCLRRLDQSTYGSNSVYVRLRKVVRSEDKSFELMYLTDFWGNGQILERHIDSKSRSTHTRVSRNVPQSASWDHLVSRVRALCRHGYRVVDASDLRLVLG